MIEKKDENKVAEEEPKKDLELTELEDGELEDASGGNGGGVNCFCDAE